MPNWTKVLEEIKACPSQPSSLDVVRRKYFQKYHEMTGRNAIAYYSGWLVVGACAGVDVNDMDTNGFMNAIHGMDCSKGLDIILHTPGGAIAAAEHLVTYLRAKFGSDIKAVVPQIAMSAGTMIACSCRSIVMGKQSALGPIDPQINGVPAKGVVEEFLKAIEEARENPESIPMWQTIISKYHPTFIDSCQKAWNRSLRMVKQWLTENMLAGKPESFIDGVVNNLATIGHDGGHDVHISQRHAVDLGLVVESMEDNQEYQDLLLTLHHCFIHTMEKSFFLKAIENHNGVATFYRAVPQKS
ncbi:MAG: S49 family peptidase [Planctomycetes bacterium]|nr:S49 family peptidase [Planctomycetota bacterium]